MLGLLDELGDRLRRRIGDGEGEGEARETDLDRSSPDMDRLLSFAPFRNTGVRDLVKLRLGVSSRPRFLRRGGEREGEGERDKDRDGVRRLLS